MNFFPECLSFAYKRLSVYERSMVSGYCIKSCTFHIYVYRLSICVSLTSDIYKVVAAQGAGALVAALEPSEQANRMECVLAGGTSLIRRLHISRYDRVADGTLALSLQGTVHVSSESQEAINQVPIGKHDDTLNCK